MHSSEALTSSESLPACSPLKAQSPTVDFDALLTSSSS
jgi:hypothetical protein